MNSITFNKILFICICLFIPYEALAQSLSTFVQDDSVEVGQVIQYSLVLQLDKDYNKIIFPDSSSFPRSLEIRRRQQFKVSAFKDSLSYGLQTFAAADLQIPSLSVYLINEADTIILYSDPVNLPFRSVLVQETGLQPIKSIFQFSRIWWPWIVAFLLFSVLAYYLWKQRESIQSLNSVDTVEVPPYQDPIENLERSLLHHRNKVDLNESSTFKQFYSGISDSIRNYYEELYRIPALESTTRELIRYLDVYGADPELTDLTRKICSEADLVKFAKFNASRDDALETFRKAQVFLEKAEVADRARIRRQKTDYQIKHGLNKEVRDTDGMG